MEPQPAIYVDTEILTTILRRGFIYFSGAYEDIRSFLMMAFLRGDGTTLCVYATSDKLGAKWKRKVNLAL